MGPEGWCPGTICSVSDRGSIPPGSTPISPVMLPHHQTATTKPTQGERSLRYVAYSPEITVV